MGKESHPFTFTPAVLETPPFLGPCPFCLHLPVTVHAAPNASGASRGAAFGNLFALSAFHVISEHFVEVATDPFWRRPRCDEAGQ